MEMARINIEDSLYTKKAWFRLVTKKDGDPEKAMGTLVFAWLIAQKFWAPNEDPIPLDVWESEELSEDLVECGFAVKQKNGVYIKGSKEQFAWLIQAHGASQKAAAKRRKEYSAGRSPAGVRAVTGRSPSELGPAPSSSSSSSFSSSKKKNNNTRQKNSAASSAKISKKKKQWTTPLLVELAVKNLGCSEVWAADKVEGWIKHCEFAGKIPTQEYAANYLRACWGKEHPPEDPEMVEIERELAEMRLRGPQARDTAESRT